MKAIHAVGTRKTSVARATLRQGTGTIRINHQDITTIPDNVFKSKMMEPVILAGELPKQVDIAINIKGGGQNSQAEAARLAIARTLSTYEKKLQETFLDYDRALLVADVRRKESSKPNRHGQSRAKRQKSYR